MISVSALIWIIVGLIAGVLARLFVPGRQLIIGVILTIIVGIAGAVISGFLLDALHIDNSTPTIAWRIIEGIIGAAVLLFIYHAYGPELVARRVLAHNLEPLAQVCKRLSPRREDAPGRVGITYAMQFQSSG